MKKIKVSTAKELSEEQKRKVLECFERKFSCPVEAEYRVVPELLGGILVVCGDEFFDGSVLSELNRLKYSL
jgi:ATP synthase subunit b-delta